MLPRNESKVDSTLKVQQRSVEMDRRSAGVVFCLHCELLWTGGITVEKQKQGGQHLEVAAGKKGVNVLTE
jgi:hypothetical protein